MILIYLGTKNTLFEQKHLTYQEIKHITKHLNTIHQQSQLIKTSLIKFLKKMTEKFIEQGYDDWKADELQFSRQKLEREIPLPYLGMIEFKCSHDEL